MAESQARRSRRHRSRRRRVVAAAVGVAVIGGGSAVGIAATNGNGPGRRLATVGIGSVTQTVESSGTITSSVKLTPSFATSGTVKAVDVQPGDAVTAGEVLAQLDTTSLQASVDSAESSLAGAKQKLEADKTGQTSAGSTGGTGATHAILSAYITEAASGSTSDLIKQVEAAQNAVIADQQHVDSGQAAVDAAQKTVDADAAQNVKLRDAQKTACADSTSDPKSGSVSDACTSAMVDYEASADTLATDLATLDTAIGTQDGNVKDLGTAISTLDQLVDQLQKAAASSGSGSGSGKPGGTPSKPAAPSSGAGRSGSGTSGSGSASGPSGSGQSGSGQSGSGQSGTGSSSGSGSGAAPTSEPASAAQLAADQASIDAAQAQLNVAEQGLGAATLKSPVAGTVAAVGLTAGSSSSGQTITVVGTGIPGVDITVSLAQVDQVKVGQPVTVSADGVAAKFHGTVASIGLLSTTSGSRTTFPVTVRLDAGTQHPFDGSGADAVIATGGASNVVTVPNSAIHSTAGGTHTVEVLQGGKPTTVRVTLGASGSDVTEVKSGLKTGQQVVLADLSEQLPSSTTSGSTGTFRLPGGGTFPNFGGR